MGFVIIIGYSVLAGVNTEVCLNSVDKEMTALKLGIEDTVNRKSSSNIFFHPDSKCFSSVEASLKIVLESNNKVCAARCGYPSDECYIMTFSNEKIAQSLRQKCLDLPPYTNFLVEGTQCGSEDLSGNGYSTVDPINSSLRIGTYVIRNVSPAGDTYPKVCVWYRSG
jgi:hypothetical protein